MIENTSNPFGSPIIDPTSHLHANGKRAVAISLMGITAMTKLSSKAYNMLSYICANLEKDDDGLIKIDRNDYMVQYKVKSQATVVNALNELIETGFILKSSKQSTYWVNPNKVIAI